MARARHKYKAKQAAMFVHADRPAFVKKWWRRGYTVRGCFAIKADALALRRRNRWQKHTKVKKVRTPYGMGYCLLTKH